MKKIITSLGIYGLALLLSVVCALGFASVSTAKAEDSEIYSKDFSELLTISGLADDFSFSRSGNGQLGLDTLVGGKQSVACVGGNSSSIDIVTYKGEGAAELANYSVMARIEFANGGFGSDGMYFEIRARVSADGKNYYAYRIERPSSGSSDDLKLSVIKVVNNVETSLSATGDKAYRVTKKGADAGAYVDLRLDLRGSVLTPTIAKSTNSETGTQAAVGLNLAETINDSTHTKGTFAFVLKAGNSSTRLGILSIEVFGEGGAPAIPPVAPSDMTAVAGDGSALISWNTVADATEYHIYQSVIENELDDEYSGEAVASVDAPLTTALIEGLTNGTTYYFGVRAANKNGLSPMSNVGAVTPVESSEPPSAITYVNFTALNQSVRVDFSPVVNAKTYAVNYGIDDVTENTESVAEGEFSHVVTGLTNDVTYKFQLSASNNVGSVVSDIVEVTPNMPSFAVVSEAWNETAVAQWKEFEGASGYNVYVKLTSADNADYKKVDDALVRGNRADIVGLKGGVSHTVMVVPLIDGVEQTDFAAENTVVPTIYDRSGFMFSNASPNAGNDLTGGYKLDGTVREDSLIVYISETTKDTAELEILTNESKGTYEKGTGIVEILKLREKGVDKRPLIIRVLGKITPPTGTDSAGLINIKKTFNVTMEGIGHDAMIYGFGLNVRENTNVEIRNLAFSQFPDDAVSIQTKNRNIWVHHCDFMVGKDGGGDKDKGDGSTDIKADSSFITISYNHYIDSGKTSLCGQGDSGEFFVTYHHNWFHRSGSRHPRVRNGTVHVYNNFYDAVYTYGIGATTYSSLFVENNYFEKTNRPMMISLVGTDVADGAKGTFSNDPPGAIKAVGNYMDEFSAAKYKANIDSSLDTRTGAAKAGVRYNDFDFDLREKHYDYVADDAMDVKDKVVNNAGTLSIVDAFAAPAAPDNLAWQLLIDENTDNEYFKLSWSTVRGASGYVLSYRVGAGAFIDIATTDNFVELKSVDVVSGMQYQFKVRAQKEGTPDSEDSAVISAIAADPSKPSNLSFGSDGTNIEIKWTSSANAGGYRVEVSLDSGFAAFDSYTTLTNAFTLADVDEVAHYFRIYAVNGKRESEALTGSYTPKLAIRTDDLSVVFEDDFNRSDSTVYVPGVNSPDGYVLSKEESDTTINTLEFVDGAIYMKDRNQVTGEKQLMRLTKNLDSTLSGRVMICVDAMATTASSDLGYLTLHNASGAAYLTIMTTKNSGDDSLYVAYKIGSSSKTTLSNKFAVGAFSSIKLVVDFDKQKIDLFVDDTLVLLGTAMTAGTDLGSVSFFTKGSNSSSKVDADGDIFIDNLAVYGLTL